MNTEIAAHHEAAHAVVNYRMAGHVGGEVSVIPSSLRGWGGWADDQVGDSFNESFAEAFVLSCYAGGHGQRLIEPASGTDGCDRDDEMALDVLTRWGWESREQEFRDRALELTRLHWLEVSAVACELVKLGILDETEVSAIADATAGDADALADLARYRAAANVDEWRLSRIAAIGGEQ